MIGGLLVSTFATLLIVPSMFVIIMGDKKKVSPSLDPDDPSSRQYDAGGHEAGRPIHGGPQPGRDATHPPTLEAIQCRVFLPRKRP